MQLPDENIEYQFQRLLVPHADVWSPVAELQAQHLLPPDELERIRDRALKVRGTVVAERELANPQPHQRPLQAGFIDLPQKLLDGYKRKQDASDLGKTLRLAQRLRDTVDGVVVLATGAAHATARALFESLCHAHHNELPPKLRMGKPRVHFEGHALDSDSLQELFELLENTCVDPDIIEERWGVVAVSRTGDALETAAAYRALRAEAAKFYGTKSPLLKQAIVPVAGAKGKFRDLLRADGFADDDVLTLPDDVGDRFGAFTPAGLLPAAVMGLDVRAMLLGAATVTRRFVEEPFERNPVLQFAAVNHLLAERGKSGRVLMAWSSKLEGVCRWYDTLVSESLGKAGRGPAPVAALGPRDLNGRGQRLLEGPRDTVVNHLVVKQPKHPPVMVGMADRNEDELNQFSRKGAPDLLDAAHKGATDALSAAARPTADLVLPMISEHTIGQLLQLLMLATVVEGRLMGVNPYGEPAADAYRRAQMAHLKAVPNLPKGEMRDATKGA